MKYIVYFTTYKTQRTVIDDPNINSEFLAGQEVNSLLEDGMLTEAEVVEKGIDVNTPFIYEEVA